MRCPRLASVHGIALLGGLAVAAGVHAEDRSFEASARPVLKAMCFHCHGEEGRPKGGLDLRLVAGIRRGGDSGPAVEPGKKEESLLWEKIAADEMPPGPKKLSAAQKVAIGAWIEAGAPAPPDEPESLPPGPSFSRAEREFWAFRPIQRHEAPPSATGRRCRPRSTPSCSRLWRPEGSGSRPRRAGPRWSAG